MNLPFIYDLKKPVMHGETEVKQVCIEREMVAGDLRGISVNAMKFDDQMLVAARLTGLPVSVINQLSIPDMLAIQGFLDSFFTPSQ